MQARYQADGLGQFCGFGVWAGVLAALDPAAVGRAQGGGEANPAGELAADRLPTGAQAHLRQAFAQQVHAVIGEHGQEQVGADAAGLDMRILMNSNADSYPFRTLIPIFFERRLRSFLNSSERSNGA